MAVFRYVGATGFLLVVVSLTLFAGEVQAQSTRQKPGFINPGVPYPASGGNTHVYPRYYPPYLYEFTVRPNLSFGRYYFYDQNLVKRPSKDTLRGVPFQSVTPIRVPLAGAGKQYIVYRPSGPGPYQASSTSRQYSNHWYGRWAGGK